jgi:hypothetical protein
MGTSEACHGVVVTYIIYSVHSLRRVSTNSCFKNNYVRFFQLHYSNDGTVFKPHFVIHSQCWYTGICYFLFLHRFSPFCYFYTRLANSRAEFVSNICWPAKLLTLVNPRAFPSAHSYCMIFHTVYLLLCVQPPMVQYRYPNEKCRE